MFRCGGRETVRLSPLLLVVLLACDSAAGIESDDGSFGSNVRDGSRGTARCTGTIVDVTVDNVVVPAGSSCVLEGTRVRGNVLVQQNASLRADGADIRGSIQADNADEVITEDDTFVGGSIQVKARADIRIEETTINGNLQVEGDGAELETNAVVIGGNLQLKQTEGGRIEDTLVRGDVQLEENDGEVAAEDNSVDGNMQVFKNVGGVVLVANRIGHTLQCKENRPPAEGTGNTARDYEDECERL